MIGRRIGPDDDDRRTRLGGRQPKATTEFHVQHFGRDDAIVHEAVADEFSEKKKQEEEAPAAPPEPSAEEKLLTEIRDALQSR